MKDTTEKYLALESTIDVNENAVVLVPAMNLRALKKAYQSYFLDTSEFLTASRVYSETVSEEDYYNSIIKEN